MYKPYPSPFRTLQSCSAPHLNSLRLPSKLSHPDYSPSSQAADKTAGRSQISFSRFALNSDSCTSLLSLRLSIFTERSFLIIHFMPFISKSYTSCYAFHVIHFGATHSEVHYRLCRLRCQHTKGPDGARPMRTQLCTHRGSPAGVSILFLERFHLMPQPVPGPEHLPLLPVFFLLSCC